MSIGQENTMDVYAEWLGIPKGPRPPDHYTLLGLERFESDLKLIENSATERIRVVKPRCLKFPEEGTRLLNEVSAAKGCLLDPEGKAAYDEWLADSRNRAVAIGVACTTAVLVLLVVAFAVSRVGRSQVAANSSETQNEVAPAEKPEPPKPEPPKPEPSEIVDGPYYMPADADAELLLARADKALDDKNVSADELWKIYKQLDALADSLGPKAGSKRRSKALELRDVAGRRFESEIANRMKELADSRDYEQTCKDYEQTCKELEGTMASAILSADPRRRSIKSVKQSWYTYILKQQTAELESLYERERFQEVRNLENLSLPEPLKDYEESRQDALDIIRDQAFRRYRKKVESQTTPWWLHEIKIKGKEFLQAYQAAESLEENFPEQKYKMSIEDLKCLVLHKVFDRLSSLERYHPKQAQEFLDHVMKSPNTKIQALCRMYKNTRELVKPDIASARKKLDKLDKDLQEHFTPVRNSIRFTKAVGGRREAFFVMRLTKEPQQPKGQKKRKQEQYEIYNGVDNATLRVIQWRYYFGVRDTANKYTWKCEKAYRMLHDAWAKHPGAKFILDPTRAGKSSDYEFPAILGFDDIYGEREMIWLNDK